ncbi:hypothetical protein CACET_c02790 [Clostridium aceticum]|uniref:Transglutaminase domain-containing protein n=1 Tax=Clostridium aceticum TaxID=84022 RepID=A0A0G3W7H0_9CLOT|nr:hypothetical protein [Clostridium aceticum]AKL93795.1 hypothetical protein CACET_c02790 [Clostridium aceticum]
MKRKVALIMVVFFSLWTLFVLYPNPYRLFVSVYRIFHPPVDAAAVIELLEEAPALPRDIENFVLERVPYQFDWQTYGVPFYFPTAAEVVGNGAGDCKSRFIVLASVFEALNIPYQQSFSLSHFWIDYEGKEEIPIEREENAFLLRTEEGFRIQLPREDLKEILEVLWEGFWEYMPDHRKVLFLLGVPMTLLTGWISKKVLTRKRTKLKFARYV